ncbi:MAG: phosphate transport system regulatory protein PhoU [Methylotenera sp.]|jgi:phosphate transport system protein|uniref:Phosphate-specific transport system accessory protein PhoU n=1 Tax=Methylotenera mobilis TaxID=359408 RepID=A0A351RC53_9PROT|nr:MULTISPECIES: phosphate signaling complex protein PhoU [Methylotenera]HBA09624.1 phosphate transport system regulatory protein PhoU [Methylotenera mobilis]MDP3212130.1 phosphate signaling complex protein PhoU [Methylotenera sp.]MDP3777337.1 phosphate signaling complex protein PhoU [Methylotenera sp.]PPC96511.1 MAG: phosphate transport system regulatory protein PhoU [Methylotenera sp.]PPC96754.1 MAG: phosphate transport system regulatory protein PhoU [Methylotenera sp.]
MHSEHTFKQYDAELEALRGKVLEMGGLVEQQIVQALEALVKLDSNLAKEVMGNDHLVNALEVQIDEGCSQIIARRQPAAGDLRMVMMMVKTITDLERIGDEATKIARTAQKIFDEDRMYKPRFNEIKSMVALVREMLRTALDGFARLDVSKTVEVARQDEQVDEHFRSAMRQLITFMLEDPRTISMSLEVLFVAKAIERIGDHAKNIAEYVVYMVKGKDVRHISVQEMERETFEP